MADTSTWIFVVSGASVAAMVVASVFIDRREAKLGRVAPSRHARHARTLDRAWRARRPAGLRVRGELTDVQPEIFSASLWKGFVKEHPFTCACPLDQTREWWHASLVEQLLHGEAEPAVVVSAAPLLVAAYSADVDAVALLHYDDALAADRPLERGTRLLAVNVPLHEPAPASDLAPGPRAGAQFGNFRSVVADFYTGPDDDELARVKAGIAEDEWRRAEELGREALAGFTGRARDGRNVLSATPGSWAKSG